MCNFWLRGSSCQWTRWLAFLLLPATVVAVLSLAAASVYGQTVTATVGVGAQPNAVSVNPVTNKIYVANGLSKTVTVIDGASNAATTVTVGSGPHTVAVNPVTNKIYVANFNGNTVTVIDGATNATTPVSAGANPYAVAVNPVTNKIYVANVNGNTVTVIDGATNTTTPVSTGANPYAVAVNPVTNKIYVANSSSATVTVISEQQVQPIPLTVSIVPLHTGPDFSVFQLFPSSSYSPVSPPVQKVYFQVDTWQGPWLRANSGASVIAVVPPLLLGLHILYAFASDGQFADSIQTGGQSSPIPGAMAAYVFLVAPLGTETSLALVSGSNPSSFGQSLTFQAAVTAQTFLIPTGSVQFKDGTTNLGMPMPLDGSGTATLVWSSFPVGTHNITAIYGGDSNFRDSSSAAWTQVVMISGAPSSTLTYLSASPQTFFLQAASFMVGTNPPSPGNVVLLDGNRQLGPMLPLNQFGIATFSTPLHVGLHQVRAVYLGNGNVNGSASLVQTVSTSPRPKPR